MGIKTNPRLSAGMLLGMLVLISLLPFWANSRKTRPTVSQHVSTTAPVLPSQFAGGETPARVDRLQDVLSLARQVLAKLNSVRDYRATLIKRERVGGVLGTESKMQIKIRNRTTGPNQTTGLAAYLKFESPAFAAGREAIWIEGQNDGKLICHEGGFKNWKTMRLDPNGSLAMLGNKYPISEIGLVRLAEKLIEKGERDRELSDALVTITDDQSVGGRKCQLIQVTHPEPVDGLDFHIAQIFVDTERRIPLRYAAYLWAENPEDEPPLEEEYTYLDVELNVGLSDAEFDPDNPDYNFP